MIPKLRAFVGFLLIIRFSAAAQEGPRTIENPGGGTIVYGQLAGQPTMREAMTRILYRISQKYGDQPQVAKILKNNTGEVLAAFFRLTAKNEGNRPVAGVAIVSVPHTGPVEGAMLSDNADRFPTTFNSLFQRLLAESGRATGSAQGKPVAPSAVSAPPAKAAAPAAPLRQTPFPDGSGTVGLPAGWAIVRAQQGDVMAKGSQGEVLRFGLPVFVIDPTNPQSNALTGGRRGAAPGNFVAIPFGADPVVAFKSASAQLAQKSRRQPPAINISEIKQLPITGGGRSFMMVGDVDQHDGQGAMEMVAQLIMSGPMPAGSWQMNIYEVVMPKQLVAQEIATAFAMLRSYQANTGVIQAQIGAEEEFTNRVFHASMDNAQTILDSSARSTQGMSEILRGQSVVRNTETGGHARVSNDLADELVNGNPNKWEILPLSEYQKGRDFQ